MEVRPDDFQSVYRRYAYPLYREVFEELKDIDETRDVVYRVFSRIREEGLEEPFGLEQRIMAYKMEFVAAQKKARLAVDRVWYQMQSDEILGRSPQEVQPAPSILEEPAAEVPVIEEPVMEMPVAETPAPVAVLPKMPEPEPVPELVAEPEPPAEPSEEPVEQETPAEAPTPEMSIDELLEDIAKTTKRRRRIREVFPDEIEEDLPTHSERAAQPVEAAVEEEPDPEALKATGRVAVVWWVVLVIVAVLFLWIFANILMSAEIIPFQDWGYSWFNENVTSLFPIPAETLPPV